MEDEPRYWRYWGKTAPEGMTGAARFHLLACHSLDVAAVGVSLLDARRDALTPLADALGLDWEQFRAINAFFMALHDVGKFARSFQSLAPELSAALVSASPLHRYRGRNVRHDTLGWLLWGEERVSGFEAPVWSEWYRIMAGHHGVPPLENGGPNFDLEDAFMDEDIEAAVEFQRDLGATLLSGGIPAVGDEGREALRLHGWALAGLVVTADWIGSDPENFPFHDRPPASLRSYWEQVSPAAARAVMRSGLECAAVASYEGAERLSHLFPYLSEPTPLQHHVATLALGDGPELFLLEDVTGAGKTEAALILAHRLMAEGRANGLYFALPTLATANQMHERVGGVYRRFFREGETPSLVLAHGARDLNPLFAESVVPSGRVDRIGGEGSLQCAAWIADHRKTAMLAEVGVGSLDQALLAVMPVRHQSLRLFGLQRKVLIVDEVHAYDVYMNRLLGRLLEAQARQGGSAILLSATIPRATRAALIDAFQRGRGYEGTGASFDAPYPLVTQVGRSVQAISCETRESVKRRVAIRHLPDVESVIAYVRAEAGAGRCVAWIRNTVEDCREAYRALQPYFDDDMLRLFHSRFVMGRRLEIEQEALTRFGKASTPEGRAGRVLVASQVIEQSLDLDFDALVTDLAPIDLLIQRAGRLQRHARSARPPPTLMVHGPKWESEPSADWYSAVSPRAQHVYPDTAVLWRTQRELERVGAIVSPGEPGEAGAVRTLIEAVYDEADLLPEALQSATWRVEARRMVDQSLAEYNALALDKGYRRESSRHWDEETRIPTRLADETRTIYLARVAGERLLPFWMEDAKGMSVWPLSAVRLDARRLCGLSPAGEQRFGSAIAALREEVRLLDAPALVIPLVPIDEERWGGEGIDARGDVKRLILCPRLGASFE